MARTFSHMARARLDHAVARSAEAEALEGEKWEMRRAPAPCPLGWCPSQYHQRQHPMSVQVSLIPQTQAGKV